MNRIINIFLILSLGFTSIFLNGGYYTCNTEKTIHFQTFCCEKAVNKTCCGEPISSKQFNKKCCDKVDVELSDSNIYNIALNLDELEDNYIALAFLYPVSLDSEEELVRNNSPPQFIHLRNNKIYILNCSYLC